MLKLNKNKFLLLCSLMFISGNFCVPAWIDTCLTGAIPFVGVFGVVSAVEIGTNGKFLRDGRKEEEKSNWKQKSLAGVLGVGSLALLGLWIAALKK